MVTVLEPPHRLEVAGQLGPFDSRLRYELTAPSPSRTELVNTVDLAMPPVLRPRAGVVAGRVAAAVAQNLEVLASRLGGSNGGHPTTGTGAARSRPTPAIGRTQLAVKAEKPSTWSDDNAD